jgi:2-haloacid dehalogenase
MARELCEKLAGKYCLYCITNGETATQHSRLTGNGLNEYFSGIFVSETIGYQKPSLNYFRTVFNAIGHFSPKKAIIVGDSLTSDIAGGKNTGIDTCWYNPSGKTAEPALAADYEIRRLDEPPLILEGE